MGLRLCPSRTPELRLRGGPHGVAALLALLTAGGALPGIGGDDRRVAIDPGTMPWAALIRLQVPGAVRCTAFLIDPQTAVTAAHCLYSLRLGHFVPAGSVHLLLGYDKGSFAKHEVAGSYTVAPGYDPAAGPAAGTRDVAVVRLLQPMASSSRTLLLVDAPLPPRTPLMLGGYGQDRAEAVLADNACTLLGYAGRGSDAVLVHDCEGTHGTSGAPVLARDAAGVWRAAGVQVTGRTDGAGGTAIPIDALRQFLGEHR